MKWIKEKLIYIILIFINFNFILRLLEKGIYIKNFDYVFTELLVILGVLIYWFYNFVLRKSMYKILVTVAIFSMTGFYYYKSALAIRSIVEKYFSKDLIVLNDLIYNGDITYFYQYKIIFIVLIPLIIALILWITFRFMKKFILMVNLAVVITLWFSNSYFVVKDNLFIYIFISTLTFIIMSYIKRIEDYKAQGVRVSLKSFSILVYGVILSLVISKITIMLPQEYKGHDATYFGTYFENKFASDEKIFSKDKDRYTLATSGYSSNDKRLGGPISINYQEAFKVKSDKPYYLKGIVKDFYDGNKWTKANENYYEKLSDEDMKFVSYGSSGIGIKKSLTVYPAKKFNTNTIFVPNYAFNVSGVDKIIYYDKAATALSGEIVKKDYCVYFYGYSEMIDTIENVREVSKKILEKNSLEKNLAMSYVYKYVLPMDYMLQPKKKDGSILTIKDAPLEDRFSYRNSEDFKIVQYYGEYLQLPENISKRTYDLVQDITKTSDSSIEKVLSIKNYLTKNYVYELQVLEIPKDSEFIDYFLFVEKKGYCTYFNTAMTVMCRIAGVPARYVEGFKLPDKKDATGLYTVSNADAHAWCEVLLGASEYSNMWTIVDASPTASEDVQKKLKQLQEEQKNTGSSAEVGINNVRKPRNVNEGIDPTQGASQSKFGILSDSQRKALNILTTVILFILMRIIKVIRMRSRLLKSKKTATLYNYYLYRLATIRIVKPEYLGDLEFAKAIENLEIRERMVILVRGAYVEFYGRQLADSVDYKEYYGFLEQHLKERVGRVKYTLDKYLG